MTTGTLIATIMLICYMIFGFAVANYCFKKYLYHMNGKWIIINILACGLLSLYMQYFRCSCLSHSQKNSPTATRGKGKH